MNREVSNALNKMDCGGEVRKTWNDLDKYVTLEDTAEMTKIETYGERNGPRYCMKPKCSWQKLSSRESGVKNAPFCHC